MENKTLLKISIAVSIVGIITLFIFTRYSLEKTVKIIEIKNFLNQAIKVSGTVNSIRISRDGHVFIKLGDETGEINVVMFKGSNTDVALNLEKGQKISVLGKVQEYKDQLEIIANSITIL